MEHIQPAQTPLSSIKHPQNTTQEITVKNYYYYQQIIEVQSQPVTRSRQIAPETPLPPPLFIEEVPTLELSAVRVPRQEPFRSPRAEAIQIAASQRLPSTSKSREPNTLEALLGCGALLAIGVLLLALLYFVAK